MIFGIKIADIIIGAAVLAIVVTALVVTIKKRKKGGCGCGCEGCSKSCKPTDKK